MFKRPPEEDCATTSANRVKSFFSSEKLQALADLLAKNQTHQMQSHHCNFIKVPRIPHVFSSEKMQKKTPPPKPKKLTLHKTSKSFDLEIGEKHTRIRELTPQRVRRWKLKEYFVAARKLSWMKKQREGELNSVPKKHEMKLIQETDSHFEEDQKKRAYWENYLKSKEERQFHLTRIIKYFTQ